MTEFWHITAILGLALITLLTRSFFFISERQWQLPDWVQRGLQFAPIAALSAVIIPEIFMFHAEISLPWTNARLFAALGGILFFVVRKGRGQVVLGTIVVGMSIYLPLHLGLGWN
jgi:branched-subunit amino acid transport protein